MTAYCEYLRRRRELLISRAAAQRSEIAYTVTRLQGSMHMVDRLFGLGRSSLRLVPMFMPVLAVAGGLLLWGVPRGKLWRWGGRLFAAWKLLRYLRRHWAGS
jgi:hypothetical protein